MLVSLLMNGSLMRADFELGSLLLCEYISLLLTTFVTRPTLKSVIATCFALHRCKLFILSLSLSLSLFLTLEVDIPQTNTLAKQEQILKYSNTDTNKNICTLD